MYVCGQRAYKSNFLQLQKHRNSGCAPTKHSTGYFLRVLARGDAAVGKLCDASAAASALAFWASTHTFLAVPPVAATVAGMVGSRGTHEVHAGLSQARHDDGFCIRMMKLERVLKWYDEIGTV